jgi:hypothetical protein
MKSIFVACLGVAALAVSSSVSQAAGGCGRGWYNNGYRCVPMNGPEPRYYREYDESPRLYYRERPEYYGDRGHPYGYNYNYGDARCGRPNYTIQDGVCKPYTGR